MLRVVEKEWSILMHGARTCLLHTERKISFTN